MSYRSTIVVDLVWVTDGAETVSIDNLSKALFFKSSWSYGRFVAFDDEILHGIGNGILVKV